jgi:hypothetical protein
MGKGLRRGYLNAFRRLERRSGKGEVGSVDGRLAISQGGGCGRSPNVLRKLIPFAYIERVEKQCPVSECRANATLQGGVLTTGRTNRKLTPLLPT